MWFLLIPAAAGLIGKLIFDAAQKPEPTVLERNLERLERVLGREGGRRVAILGQPGAGKSSLLIKMSSNRVTPRPVVGVHTDATSWADDSSVALLSRWENFVVADVPGYDTASHPVGPFLRLFPFDEFHMFIFVIRGKLHEADERMMRCVQASRRPMLVVRSYAETIDRAERDRVLQDIQARLSIQSTSVLFASNRTGEGVEEVLRWIARP
jgi:GTP-binding protein EngB required for normal cell division